MQQDSFYGGYAVEQFLQRWGISRNTFYAEIAKGDLKTIKIGRRRIVTLRGEQEWLKDKEEKAGLK